MVGINELKDLLSFLATFGNNISDALSDGEIDWTDFVTFFPSLTKLAAALNGIEKIGAELIDMTPEERIELDNFVVGELDVSNDQIETWIEDGFKVFTHLFEFVSKFYLKEDPERASAISAAFSAQVKAAFAR